MPTRATHGCKQPISATWARMTGCRLLFGL
jgi:hypothetical protein